MIVFGRDDAQMLDHVVYEARDIMFSRGGFTEEDCDTMEKLGGVAKAATTGTVLIIDGREQPEDEARDLFRQIVETELDNWVPDASQRLIRRAAAALDQVSGVRHEDLRLPDCGPDRRYHPLLPNWVAGIYVLQCATCDRLFRA